MKFRHAQNGPARLAPNPPRERRKKSADETQATSAETLRSRFRLVSPDEEAVTATRPGMTGLLHSSSAPGHAPTRPEHVHLMAVGEGIVYRRDARAGR